MLLPGGERVGRDHRKSTGELQVWGHFPWQVLSHVPQQTPCGVWFSTGPTQHWHKNNGQNTNLLHGNFLSGTTSSRISLFPDVLACCSSVTTAPFLMSAGSLSMSCGSSQKCSSWGGFSLFCCSLSLDSSVTSSQQEGLGESVSKPFSGDSLLIRPAMDVQI